MANYIFDPTDLLYNHPPVGITIVQDHSQVDIWVDPVTDFTVYLRQILATDIDWYIVIGTPSDTQGLYTIKSMIEQNVAYWRNSRQHAADQWPNISVRVWRTELQLHPYLRAMATWPNG